jgi:hypothetical protein
MRHTKAAKEAMYARLVQIKSAGRLTKDAVVQDARKKSSPLHSYFEWDDSIAGQRYRLVQAEELIGEVTVLVEYGETRVVVPRFPRDPTAPVGKQGHADVLDLRSDKDKARLVVIAAAQQASAHLQRVRDLAIGVGLEEEVEEIITRFVLFLQQLEMPA